MSISNNIEVDLVLARKNKIVARGRRRKMNAKPLTNNKSVQKLHSNDVENKMSGRRLARKVKIKKKKRFENKKAQPSKQSLKQKNNTPEAVLTGKYPPQQPKILTEKYPHQQPQILTGKYPPQQLHNNKFKQQTPPTKKRKGNFWKRSKKFRKKSSSKRRFTPLPSELIFIHRSPNFCKPIRTLNHQGTSGRQCLVARSAWRDNGVDGKDDEIDVVVDGKVGLLESGIEIEDLRNDFDIPKQAYKRIISTTKPSTLSYQIYNHPNKHNTPNKPINDKIYNNFNKHNTYNTYNNNHNNNTGSCDNLCCGRGYSSRVVATKKSCECEVRWCCEVVCRTCVVRRVVHTCN